MESSPILLEDEGERINSYAGIQYAYDTRNTGLDPTQGVRLQFGAEYAGLGGDAEYLRATFLGIAERQVMREEVTLRASFEAGAIETLNGNSRLSDRFKPEQSPDARVRGQRHRAAGSDRRQRRCAWRQHVRRRAVSKAAFPLGLPDEYGITGGLFYDIGSLWGLDNTNGGLVDDDLYWRQTVRLLDSSGTPSSARCASTSRTRLAFEDYDRTREFDLTIEARF